MLTYADVFDLCFPQEGEPRRAGERDRGRGRGEHSEFSNLGVEQSPNTSLPTDTRGSRNLGMSEAGTASTKSDASCLINYCALGIFANFIETKQRKRADV